jgi:hypothetical protein
MIDHTAHRQDWNKNVIQSNATTPTSEISNSDRNTNKLSASIPLLTPAN